MRVLVDTNVLLRTVQPQSPHHLIAKDALWRLDDSGVELVVAPQVLYEYWVAGTRPLTANGLGMTAQLAEQSIERILDDFHLLRDERGIFSRWRQLVVEYQILGKPAHDARLVAAMLRHGLTHILTFNQEDFERFSGIEVISPEAVAAGRWPT
jgi:predicted nucleic acid-binding protein